MVMIRVSLSVSGRVNCLQEIGRATRWRNVGTRSTPVRVRGGIAVRMRVGGKVGVKARVRVRGKVRVKVRV